MSNIIWIKLKTAQLLHFNQVNTFKMLVLKLNHLTDFRMNLNKISHESIPQWIYTSIIFYSKENANI